MAAISQISTQGSFLGKWVSESLLATSPLSTVSMDSVDLELQTDFSPAEHIEGVVTKPH